MKTRVAVVYGGRSGEHEISLLSAESVIAAMNPERYEVIRFLITKPDLKAIAKAEAERAEKAEQAAKRGDSGESDRSDDKDKEEE